MKDKFVLVLSYIHLLYSVGIVLLILLEPTYRLDEYGLIIIAYHFVTFLLGSLFYWKSSRNFTILSIVALVPVIVPLLRFEYEEVTIIYIMYLLLLIALGIRKDINTINKPTKQ